MSSVEVGGKTAYEWLLTFPPVMIEFIAQNTEGKHSAKYVEIARAIIAMGED